MKGTMTLSKLAEETRKHFKLDKHKADGHDYWKAKDGAPKWIKDLCQKAHDTGGGHLMLPDDFRYEFIVNALDALSEHEDENDALDSLEPDIYNSELHKWLSSHLERAGYVDEAVKEMGGHSDNGIDGDIALGQLHEKREVFFHVKKALEDRLEEIEDEEE